MSQIEFTYRLRPYVLPVPLLPFRASILFGEKTPLNNLNTLMLNRLLAADKPNLMRLINGVSNRQLTHGRDKFYFTFLYLDRRFPQATYPVSRGGLVRNKPRYLDRSVVVETYKIRVNASMESQKGNGPSSAAWKAAILPLYYCDISQLSINIIHEN